MADEPHASVPLPGLLTFERVARRLNFARAAAELEITPTAVSRTVKQIEAKLGVRLLNRTTRSVALTEAGAELLASLAPALEQIRASVERARASSGRPSGLLRLNSSGVAFTTLIEPHLAAFADRYPDVVLDVQIDNGLSDIVAQGFDAGIRLGHALQRDMVALPMGPLQQLVVVGAPAYLARRGTPKVPKDLLEHECIRQRLGGSANFLDWEFTRGGKATSIAVQGRFIFNEMCATLAAARAGCGLAYVFRQLAAVETREGELSVLLDRYTRPEEAFHLYYPSRALMPAKLRVFVDFIRAANWSVPA
jgi:DNA-binding transcriptional LysR family regulator